MNKIHSKKKHAKEKTASKERTILKITMIPTVRMSKKKQFRTRNFLQTLLSKPQSPITPKPDDSNTSTSPVTEHAVPDEKEKDKTRQNRGSDSSMEEAGRGEAAEN